jgi:acetylornithine/N-succinyldiaminopimelate aminotransferase
MGERDAGETPWSLEAALLGPEGASRDLLQRALEADADYLMQTYGRAPTLLTHGRGTRVWDSEGREYLDFLCGLSVTNLGHCHPRVVAAIAYQAGRLGHVSNLYHTLPQLALAAELRREAFPGRVFFCNSGSEANEAALKLARKAAWRRAQAQGGEPATEIVYFQHSFHGRTYGSLSATRGYQEGFGPMVPSFREAPWNDAAAAEESIGPATAAVIVEPVQGEGGVRVASPEFLQALRRACDRHGACLILDEVQTGFGRTGRVFAHTHFGVRPDVLTMGKALGGGLPMGGILAADPWGAALQRGDHGTTFGGNPIVAMAGLAALHVLREERLADRAAALGDGFQRFLREATAPMGYVREVRGLGLMIGIELEVGGPAGAEVVRLCRERGLLVNCTAGTVIRVMPPLSVTEEELQRGGDILIGALRAAAAAGTPS